MVQRLEHELLTSAKTLLTLQEKADISDKETAKPLELKGGSIQFDNVHFG